MSYLFFTKFKTSRHFSVAFSETNQKPQKGNCWFGRKKSDAEAGTGTNQIIWGLNWEVDNGISGLALTWQGPTIIGQRPKGVSWMPPKAPQLHSKGYMEMSSGLSQVFFKQPQTLQAQDNSNKGRASIGLGYEFSQIFCEPGTALQATEKSKKIFCHYC